MKFLKALAAICGIFCADYSSAQDYADESIFSQVKDALSGRHRGKAISKAAIDIYSGGVKYGNTVTNPSRTQSQTRDGVAGGLQAVGGGAALAGAIGRTGGSGAVAMAVPINGGISVLPEYVTQSNSLARKLELIAKGDGATLEKEHVQQVQRAQQAGAQYRKTINNLITAPNTFDLGLAERLNQYAKDTLKKAQGLSDSASSEKACGNAVCEEVKKDPAENSLDKGWKIVAETMSYENAPSSFEDSCFPLEDKIDDLAGSEMDDYRSNGCTILNYLHSGEASRQFQYECVVPSNGAWVRGTVDIAYSDGARSISVNKLNSDGARFAEQTVYGRCE